MKKNPELIPIIYFLKVLLKKEQFHRTDIGGMEMVLLFHVIYAFFLLNNEYNNTTVEDNAKNFN